MPVIMTLGRLRQEDVRGLMPSWAINEFKASLNIAKPCLKKQTK